MVRPSVDAGGLHHPGHWEDNIHLLPMPPGMESKSTVLDMSQLAVKNTAGISHCKQIVLPWPHKVNTTSVVRIGCKTKSVEIEYQI